jgi:microcompartment protein CcmK/EutM
MAKIEKTVIPVEVQSNLDSETKKAQKFSEQIEKAKKNANFTPKAQAAARAGMDARNAQLGQESSTARGIGGLTGAKGRDFAAQAQGLGGLVHVYATFAANLFAVSAAFNALSKAADTTNMVKGLDQLGAQSGRNLGGLAKQLALVTDNAISMRESMSATVLASSGGMSSESILRMGKVARGASIALGVDMTNAVSRLSRGITKLEPELLDEIGIMVRIDRASQDYARTLGKTVSSLTDFEKRQGFANAVLEEGERKFGKIAAEANPYSKLSASIQNLTQDGLELVNKVLKPIIDFLSQSPTALSVALASIGTILLKQAIPAIGMYRENARRMANETRDRVAKQIKDQQVALTEGDRLADEAAQARFAKDKANAKRAADIQLAAMKSAIGGKTIDLLKQKSAFELTKEDISKLNDRASKLLASDKELYQKQGAELKAHLAEVNRIRAEMSEAGYKARLARGSEDDPGRLSQESLNRRNLARLEAAQLKSNIKLATADNAATLGSREAFRLLREEISKTNFNAFTKGMMTVSGAMTIATSKVGSLISAFQPWLMLIGLASAALVIMDSYLTNSAKESEAFSDSLSLVESALKAVDKTLEVIALKTPFEKFTAETIQARANALVELNSSLRSAVYNFERLQAAQNGWDKFWDGLWDVVGKGSADKLAKEISASVIKAFQVMENGPAKDAAKKAIQEIVGQDIDFENITNFNDKIKDLDKIQINLIGSQISKVLTTASNAAGNAADNITAAKNAMKELNKQFDDFSNSIKANDEFTKMSEKIILASTTISTALNNVTNGLVILYDLSIDLKTLSFLPPDTANNLVKASNEIQNLGIQLNKAREEASAAQKQYAEMSKEVDRLNSSANAAATALGTLAVPKNNAVAQAAIAAQVAAQVRVDETQATLTALEESNRQKLNDWRKVSTDLWKEGIDYAEKGLTRALGQAGIVAAKEYTNILKSIGADTAKVDYITRSEELQYQKDDIELRYKVLDSLESLKIALDKDRTSREKESAEANVRAVKSLGGTKSEEDIANERLKTANIEYETVLVAERVMKLGGAKVREFVNASRLLDNNMSSGERAIQLGAADKLRPKAQLERDRAARLAVIEAERRAAGIKLQVDLMKEVTKESLRQVNTAQKLIGLEHIHLGNLNKVSGEYIKENSDRHATLELLRLDNDLAQKRLNISLQEQQANFIINSLSNSKKKGDVEQVKAAEAYLKISNDIRANDEYENRIAKETAITNIIIERVKGEQTLKDIRRDTYQKLSENSAAISQSQNDIQKSTLEYAKGIGILSEEQYEKNLKFIELSEQQKSYEQERLRIQNEYNKQLDKEQNTIDIVRQIEEEMLLLYGEQYSGLEEANNIIKKAEENRTRINLLAESELFKLNAQNAARKAAIEAQRQQNIEVAKHLELLTKIDSLTQSLEVLFDNVGAGIGAITKELVKLAKNEKDYLAEKIRLQEQANSYQDTDSQKTQALEGLAKLEEDHRAREIDGYAASAKAAKEMFKQKTGAAKAFAAVEKALAIYKMVLLTQQMASELTAAAISVKASIIKAEAAGAETVVKATAETPGPWWVKLAAGLAAIAFVASILGGKGGKAPAAGATAAEMQETQGTGMSWVDGKKVETGGGVYGDAEAKSQSTRNSIDLLNENVIEGLGYDRRMVKALESIDRAIGQTAKGLYNVPGLRSGSAFGTPDVSVSTKGIKGFFGKSTTSEIINSGLKLSGSIADLAENADGLVQYFETVRKTKKSSGFFGIGGKTSIWDETTLKPADEEVEKLIGGVFKHSANMIKLVGEKTGLTSSWIESELDKITVDPNAFVSLRGLKGKELEDEFSAVINTILDDAASTIFPAFEKYRNFGEGMLETVNRVVDGNEKVKVALDSIGIDTSKTLLKTLGSTRETFGTIGSAINGVLSQVVVSVDEFSYDVTEALIEGAGGLDNFTSQIEYFRDNFLTEEERLAPVMENVTNTLAKLGYAGTDTREEFADLIQGLDLTTKYGQETYQALMDLAPAFAEVYEETRKVVDAEELRKQTLSQTIEILKLEGKTGEALMLQRIEELGQIDKSLQAGQLYLYSLQDESSIKAQLIAQYEKETAALQAVIDSLDQQIKSLNEYKDSLKVGTSSTLTPLQKYEESKKQFEDIKAASMATIDYTADEETISAQLKTRNEAISKLPAASAAFLDASKLVFASSENYIKDFNYVLATIEETNAILASDKDKVQAQLDYLEASYEALGIIKETQLTALQLMDKYEQAKIALDEARNDYFVDLVGMTAEMLSTANLTSELMANLVEITKTNLVDYSNPTGTGIIGGTVGSYTPPVVEVVPTAPGSATEQGQLEQLAALRESNARLVQLLEQSQQETRDLIATNYDATQRAANTVVEAINSNDNSLYNQYWTDRYSTGP